MSDRREPEHLSTKQLALRIGVHHHTLEKWRMTGMGGPPFVRMGRRIIYRWWEVEAWMSKRQYQNTSQYVENSTAAPQIK